MNRLFVFIFVITLAFAMPVAAADAQKIAVVDIKMILDESTAAKGINKQIEEKRNSYQSQVAKEEEALKKEDKKLSEQRSVLSKEAFEEKAKSFRKKVVDAQKDVQTKRTKLENAYTEALGKVRDATLKIISDLAKDKGFDIAVPKSQVLYSKDNLDISKEVLEKLNKQLPDVKVVVGN